MKPYDWLVRHNFPAEMVNLKIRYMVRKQVVKLCLRVIDLLDLTGLVVLTIIAIKAYHERGTYYVNGLYLVREGFTAQDCEDAYEFSATHYAQDAKDVINRFNAFPIVLAVISMTIDLTLSVAKLACKITDKADKAMTTAEIILTFLFAPIAFPVSDFDYDTCVGTGLTDSIMESLGTYATLGLSLLLYVFIIVAVLLVIVCVCKKNKKAIEGLGKIGICAIIIIMLIYLVVALIFVVLALLGTAESLATGLLTGFAGVVEGLELYVAFRDLQDAKNKIGLG